MKIQLTPQLILVAAVSAAIGAAATGLALRAPTHSMDTTSTAAKKERKVLYWTDPMVPGFKSDKPGKSPFMDMEMVPVYEDEAGSNGAPIVTIRPEVSNSLGVRTVEVTRKNGALVVPRDALIRTGFRNSVVLALGDGRFRPVEVVPGAEVGDSIEIRQGLKEKDRVVVSGQFLIDSEASVRASFERMTPADSAAPAAPAQPHQH
jgi:hypothetical protein